MAGMFIPKSDWGDGPWQSEPDGPEQWTDAATGMSCLVIRNPTTGTWCGYVGVAHDHPAFGLPTQYHAYMDDFPDGPHPLFDGMRELEQRYREQRRDEREMAKGRPVVQTFVNGIAVHGGLTWSGNLPAPADPTLHWFGFDTGHAGDRRPAIDALMRELPPGPLDPWLPTGGRYRTLKYVRKQCASLAQQLADIAATVAQDHNAARI